MIEYGWIICPQGGRPGLASAGQAQAMCDTPEGAEVPGGPWGALVFASEDDARLALRDTLLRGVIYEVRVEVMA